MTATRAHLRLLMALSRCSGGSQHADEWAKVVGSAAVATARKAGHVVALANGHLVLTEDGRRQNATSPPLANIVAPPVAVDRPVLDDGESPLGWLARRRSPDGTPLISPAQFTAGERLRTDFTLAGLTPRVTASWTPAAHSGRRGAPSDAAHFTDMRLAARQRLDRALTGCGPEFAGILLDVCCFLKGLEQVERERRWPSRSGKVVLMLALDRLARHYGLSDEARGPARAAVRTWLAEGEQLVVPTG